MPTILGEQASWEQSDSSGDLLGTFLVGCCLCFLYTLHYRTPGILVTVVLLARGLGLGESSGATSLAPVIKCLPLSVYLSLLQR